MTQGAPRKTEAQKELAGTEGKHPPKKPLELIEEPLKEIPLPPLWLSNIHATIEWERVARILIENKLLTESSLSSLGVLCSMYGKLIEVFEHGGVPKAAELQQYRNLANDFGLTPMSQARLKPTGPAKSKNRFSKFGRDGR